MQYREFGQTGFLVSALGFGAMNLPNVSLQQAGDTLNYALDHGINYMDTAANYRNSEEIIGECIAHRRSEYFLATKTAQRDYASAKHEIEQSLVKMKTDVLDLVQIHYVNYPADMNKVMGEGGAYQALKEAKEAGKIRFIGITGHRPDLLARWIQRGAFDQVLFHLSLVQPFALEELVPMARQLNIGRTAMKPLSGGFVRPVDQAMRYTYSQDIHVMISGMQSIAEVRENLRALEAEVTQAERRELESLALELGQHHCRRCNYCSCPIEIPIPDVMISSVVRQKFGLLGRGEQFFEKNQGKLNACATYEPCQTSPLCEQQCPYQLPMSTVIRRSAQLQTKHA